MRTVGTTSGKQQSHAIDGRRLSVRAFGELALLALLIGLGLFPAAGSLHYLAGWVFLGVFCSCSFGITLFIAITDPALLERRLAAGPLAEQRPRQKIIQALAGVLFVASLIVAGLDRRWGWSRMSLPLVLLGEAGVVLGFLIVLCVFRKNSFASALVEVRTEQRLVTSGPYACVRHPMYAGAVVLVAGLPLALGSWWDLAILVPFAGMLVSRLLDEEALLLQQLNGYDEYCRKTPYRLIPYLW